MYFKQKISIIWAKCLFAAVIFLIGTVQIQAQYCAADYSGAGNCIGTDLITHVEILGTTLDNNVSTCIGNSRVNGYPASGNTTATLYTTANFNTYKLSVTTNSNSIISVWIDFNHNNTFDVSEWQQITTSSAPNKADEVMIMVPANAYIGQTGMRIRTRSAGNGNGSIDACTAFNSGMAHDYIITIDSLAPCIGKPTAGVVKSDADSVCAASTVYLYISGATMGSGQTIQWQTSTNGINWNDISGANASNHTAAPSISTYYRYYTICGVNADTSSIKLITIKPFYNCGYCSSGATTTDDDDIGKFTLGKFTNGIDTLPSTQNNKSANTYTDYTYLIADTFDANQKYFAEITQINNGNYYTSNAKIYIDFNQNSQFEPNEEVFSHQSVNPSNLAGGNVMKDSIYIPSSAMEGFTRLRAVIMETPMASDVKPCGTYTWGETEDYLIYIRLPACNATPVAGNAISSVTQSCANSPIVLSLQGNSYGGGQLYQWQSSSDTTHWSNISGANKGNCVVNQTIGTYYRCYITCNGKSDTSKFIYVDLAPLYNCYCTPIHANCNANDQITNFTIQNTALNNSPMSCPNGAVNPYYIYAPQGSTTAHMVIGSTYQMEITTNTTSIISAWIDYNHNGNYEASEWTQIATSSTANVPDYMNITIPASALTGKTGMRIRTRLAGNQNGPGDACLTMASGQAHDYIITLINPSSKDIGVVALTAPGQYSCYGNAENVSAMIQNLGIDTLDFAKNACRIKLDISNGLNTSLDTTLTSGTLLPGNTIIIDYNKTIDMTGNGVTFDFVGYTQMANDSNPYNDTLKTSLSTVQPISQNYIENFDNAATVPYSYTVSGFGVSASGGTQGSGSLKISMDAVITATIGNSPIVGPLTSTSVFKFSYLASKKLAVNDSVAVYLTVDCGKTFKQIYTINASNTDSNLYQSFEYNLASYIGNNAAIAFYSINNSLSTYDIDIDNVIIGEKPVIHLGNDTAVCGGIILNANMNQQPNYLIQWSGGSMNDTLLVYTSGTYWASATDIATGLSASDTIKVTVYMKPLLDLGIDKSICPKTATILDAGIAKKYLWSTNDTTQKISVSIAKTYFIDITDSNGCQARDSISVALLAGPNAAFTYQVSGSNDAQFKATDSTAGNKYLWDFGDGNTDTVRNPLHHYNSSGTYTTKLIITNANNCSDTFTAALGVNNGISGIKDLMDLPYIYPNPYTNQTSLSYTLNRASMMIIELYDIAGRKISTLENGMQSQGKHQLLIDTRDQLSGGIYTLRIVVNGEVSMIKIIDFK